MHRLIELEGNLVNKSLCPNLPFYRCENQGQMTEFSALEEENGL